MAKKQKLSWEGSVLTVQYPSLRKSVVVNIEAFKPELRAAAERHGWKQRFGDLESGKSPREKYDAACALKEHYVGGGEWEMDVERGVAEILIEAVAVEKGIEVEKVRKVIEAKPEKVQEWASNLKIKLRIAQIRAERAAKALEESESEDEIDVDLE